MVHQSGRAAFLAGAATLFICFALPAHARFGKASSGSHGSSSHGTSSHGGSSSGGSYHAAAPAGHPTTGGTYVAPGYRTRCSYYWGCRGGSAWWYGYYSYYPFFGYGPPYFYYPYDGSYVGLPPAEPAVPALTASLGIEAQAQPSGSASSLGLDLRLEGQRLGLNGEFQSILLRSDDGVGNDNIRLLNFYLTYALLVSPHGRLRLEAGVTSAYAPDLVVAGPSAGLSAIANIWGPLAVEGSTHITAFPYTQFDWQAGLALGFGPLGVRAGWRRIFLNDQGLVDGVSHKDVFNGPYVGLALML